MICNDSHCWDYLHDSREQYARVDISKVTRDQLSFNESLRSSQSDVVHSILWEMCLRSKQRLIQTTVDFVYQLRKTLLKEIVLNLEQTMISTA